MGPGNFFRGDGVHAQYFPGCSNFGGGGVQLLFSIETCNFQYGRSGPPAPLNMCMTYMHVSCVKPLKVTKNVAGSLFSKGICSHGH